MKNITVKWAYIILHHFCVFGGSLVLTLTTIESSTGLESAGSPCRVQIFLRADDGEKNCQLVERAAGEFWSSQWRFRPKI